MADTPYTGLKLFRVEIFVPNTVIVVARSEREAKRLAQSQTDVSSEGAFEVGLRALDKEERDAVPQAWPEDVQDALNDEAFQSARDWLSAIKENK